MRDASYSRKRHLFLSPLFEAFGFVDEGAAAASEEVEAEDVVRAAESLSGCREPSKMPIKN